MTALPEWLVSYIEQRDAARVDAVNAALAKLTDRERALVKDAAVMGYVRGRMHPDGEDHPKDGQVLVEVIDACLAHPDLYPAVNAGPVPDAHPPRHRWQVETRDPLANEWVPGTRFTDRAEAVQRHEALNDHHPTWADGTPVDRRFVRETTSFTVEEPQR
jgi:hypothetical protein